MRPLQQAPFYAQWRLPLLRSVLDGGGVVACPAEGVWGLSCDPYSEAAVDDLLTLKQRSVRKGLIVVAADAAMFDAVLSYLSPDERHQVCESWPGPNTWLVPNHGVFPGWITGDSTDVAIRVTSALPLKGLSESFGGALVSTSANPAGLPPPQYLWALRRYFGVTLPALPGMLEQAGKPSTIRRIGDGTIVRP
ncbi:Sua5/YciO/YrdC/YwlC family protein [Luminiphilus sp.]|jgi:L-threonylcarbamoyladenylate synthase|nr:Sua5/YciO/YrdC/YwlC family protein [Luminiphilus sp.]